MCKDGVGGSSEGIPWEATPMRGATRVISAKPGKSRGKIFSSGLVVAGLKRCSQNYNIYSLVVKHTCSINSSSSTIQNRSEQGGTTAIYYILHGV